MPSRPLTSTTSSSVTASSSMISARRSSGAPADIFSRITSPRRRRFSAVSNSRTRSSASSSTSRSLSRSTRKVQWPRVGIAGEQHSQMQQQQLLQRQEAVLAGLGRAAARSGRSAAGSAAAPGARACRSPAPAAAQAQKPVFGMKGNGCAGSMASGDSTGKTLFRKCASQMLQVPRGQLAAGQKRDAVAPPSRACSWLKVRLLGLHQAARVGVDQGSCSRRAAARRRTAWRCPLGPVRAGRRRGRCRIRRGWWREIDRNRSRSSSGHARVARPLPARAS